MFTVAALTGLVLPATALAQAEDADPVPVIGDSSPESGEQDGDAEEAAPAAAISLDVRVDRASASVGDLLTWVVTARNDSAQSYRYSPQSGVGGVVITDAIPHVLRFVPESPTARIRSAGSSNWSPVEAAGQGSLNVELGQLRDGEWTPFDLPAGAELELRYTLLVSSEARPGTRVTGRVEVRSRDNHGTISNVVRPRVQIREDHEFDQGILMGRVFCDEDGNGRQSVDERGLPGARIYLDNGTFVSSDADGGFHFSSILPGLHLIKIDRQTLPVDSALVSDEARAFEVTRGLPSRIDFAVRCTEYLIEGIEVIPGDGALAEALRLRRERFFEAQGNVLEPALQINGVELPLDAVTMRAWAGEQNSQAPESELLDLELRGEALVAPLQVELDVPPGADGWIIEVLDAQGKELLWQRAGSTGGRVSLAWQGETLAGAAPLLAPEIYQLRARILWGNSRLVMPAPRWIRMAAVEARVLAQAQARFAGEPGLPDNALAQALDELRRELPGDRNVTLEVEVHLDDEQEPEDALLLTQTHAAFVAEFVSQGLRVEPRRITSRGMGSTRPLVPNIGDRARATNRRVEIRMFGAGADVIVPEFEQPEVEPGVWLGERWFPADAQGDIEVEALRPSDGLIALTLVDARGGASSLLVSLHDRLTLERGRPVVPEVEVRVDTAAGEVRIGSESLRLPGLELRVAMMEPYGLIGQRSLEPVLRFPFTGVPADTLAWRFEVVDATGNLRFEQEGLGAPPGGVRWQGRTVDNSPLLPGVFEARMHLQLEGGATVSSPAYFFRIFATQAEADRAAELEPAVPDPSRVRINGEVPEERAGRQRSLVRAMSGSHVLVEVELEGASLVMPVPVPPGFELEFEGVVPIVPFVLGDEAVPTPSAPAATPQQERQEERPDTPPATPPAEVPRPSSPFSPISQEFVPRMRLKQASPPVATGQPLLTDHDELVRRFGAQLQAALSTEVDDLASALARTDAARITVQLPPPGVVLPSRTLSVFGSTVPTNRVFINGREVFVSSQGRFDTVVELPGGHSDVRVETLDLEGNRGLLDWPVQVSNSSFFVMALADTAVGTSGAEIAGANSRNLLRTDSGVQLYGQARLYMRGWVSGAEILSGHWDDFNFSAHVDTGHEAQAGSFLREVIQPDRQYPVWGDASEEVADVNSRGRVFVLVQADDSSATWGNFNTAIQGLEHFRYERNLHGARVALDERIGEHSRTELRAHFAGETADIVQARDFLRGTGGSIYYLSHRQVVEGSERVALVVRDSISGVELARMPMTRNADYTLRYSEGRILMKSPVPSVADAGLLLGHYTASRSTLDGHPVSLEVTYDHEGGRNASDRSWGVQARETLFDWVRVGGGVVDESRRGGRGYRLWNVEAGVGPTETSRIDFELTGSESRDMESLYSDDGGLNFQSIEGATQQDAQGRALLVRGSFEIADVLELGRDQVWSLSGYYQDMDRGFFSHGSSLEQGQTKYGFSTVARPLDNHRLTLRFDRIQATVDALGPPSDDPLATLERRVILSEYNVQVGALQFSLGYTHTDSEDNRLAEPYSTDIIGLEGQIQVFPWLRLGLGQEFIVAGTDPRILRGEGSETTKRIEDHFITTVSAALRVSEDLELLAANRFRYSGENSTIVGLNSRVDENSNLYLQQRFHTPRGSRGTATSTVVGGEQRYGADGSARAYGETHFDHGISGERTRAVLGFGKRWQVLPGLNIDLALERSQTLAADSVQSESRRNTVSAGWEYVRPERLKLTGLLEGRFDRGSLHTPALQACLATDIGSNPAYCRDRVPSLGDRRQLVAMTSLVANPTDAVTLFGRFEFVATRNTTVDELESRDAEGSVGVSYRPLRDDWLTLLGRYTWLGEMAPYGLEVGERREDRSHVISLSPIVQLPYGLQLVEKVAFRHRTLDVEGMPSSSNLLTLWINRLNYRVFRQWDVGAEYRFLHQSLSGDWLHGLLLDVNYILAEHVRLGVGYNFSRFAEDELGDFDRDASGFFFRVVAHY